MGQSWRDGLSGSSMRWSRVPIWWWRILGWTVVWGSPCVDGAAAGRAPRCGSALGGSRWWTGLVGRCCGGGAFVCSWMSLEGGGPACAELDGRCGALTESPVICGRMVEWPWNKEGTERQLEQPPTGADGWKHPSMTSYDRCTQVQNEA